MNHKILALLRENARMGIQEIALRSGLPEAEAEQEIRELEKSGVIRGYTAILNESELDDNKVKALIEVKVSPMYKHGFDAIAEEIYQFDEVRARFVKVIPRDYERVLGLVAEAETAGATREEALERYGINPEGVGCAGKASLMLDRLAKRREEGLSTPKQIRFLEGRGFRRVGTWTQADASAMISRISANGWRTPRSGTMLNRMTTPTPRDIHEVVLVLTGCPINSTSTVSSNFRQSNLPAGTSTVSAAVTARSLTCASMLISVPIMLAANFIVAVP